MIAVAFVIICISIVYDFTNVYKNFGNNDNYINYTKQAIIKFVVGFLLAVSLAN